MGSHICSIRCLREQNKLFSRPWNAKPKHTRQKKKKKYRFHIHLSSRPGHRRNSSNPSPNMCCSCSDFQVTAWHSASPGEKEGMRVAEQNTSLPTVVLMNLDLRSAPSHLPGGKKSRHRRPAWETGTDHVSHKMRKTLDIWKENKHCWSQEEINKTGNILWHVMPQNTFTKS